MIKVRDKSKSYKEGEVRILLLYGVGFLLCGALSAAGQTPHKLTVGRFTTTSLTNADADRIFGDATTVLWVADYADDVACDVVFSRAGNVGTFNTGIGIINSQADY